MKYIDKLLQGEKVEWKPLGEVAKLSRGRVISKDFLRDNRGKYPVYSSQTLNNGELGKINSFDFNGDFLTWTTDGAHAGTIFKRSGKFSITNVCGLIDNNKEKIDLNFLYHWLSSVAKKYVYSGMGNPKLMSNQMEKILIPIPPLPVQQEIAKILDNFSTLTAELEAELVLRKKQYEYYRNHLLTPDEKGVLNGKKVEWKTLGEVVKIKNGKDWKSLNSGNIPVYGSGGIMAYVDGFTYNKVSVLIPRKGTITNIFYVDTAFWNVDTIFYTEIDENQILPKYFYYFMVNFDLTKLSTDSTRPSLTQTVLNKIKIPIPPMEEQERIAGILDKFDTLVNSISEGLPKEIELRRKQYEYYRKKLLSFQ